jgi:hypothetical protein
MIDAAELGHPLALVNFAEEEEERERAVQLLTESAARGHAVGERHCEI